MAPGIERRAVALALHAADGRTRPDWAEPRRRAAIATRSEWRRRWTARLSAAQAGERVDALLLVLGGAPTTWHEVADLPGRYHVAIPTGIGGGRGEPRRNQALAAAADDGCPVALVQLTEAQVAEMLRRPWRAWLTLYEIQLADALCGPLERHLETERRRLYRDRARLRELDRNAAEAWRRGR